MISRMTGQWTLIHWRVNRLFYYFVSTLEGERKGELKVRPGRSRWSLPHTNQAITTRLSGHLPSLPHPTISV
jgi:hypothetical protein